ncbi:LuxR C-terminal-related transcriptional regulator [Actinomycetospora endophytica]|uniref:LuxR C-terminal-related transcriptional regulator n=2 Tax=Actinomycetospora endophytica TaxID=2291215 RepID=A0ABS8P625_9PSEU|nr:LuxR C-terminal-related transcriptional regulator [Actinomycetospora endophytica]
MLTLVGAAGAGKTRLALAVAMAETDALVIDLATVSDPRGLLPAVADAAGLGDGGARPLLEIVGDYLHDRAPLLVLDNLEHLVDAADDVSALIGRSGRTRVLGTSRTPLRIPGERLVPVEPLAVPDVEGPLDPDPMGRIAAVALFVERVRDRDPSFALSAQNALVVAEICVALDGLPLALELAAAHVRGYGLDDVLARADGRLELFGTPRGVVPRHRSLGAALDWSLDLLDPSTRGVFADLSVFPGGCDARAAEAVSGRGAVRGLGELVDHSLLRAVSVGTGMRYAMLATVRESAVDLLEQSGRRRVVDEAYRDWAETVATEVGRAFGTTDEAFRLDRAEAEHTNLRRALDAAPTADPRALRTATELAWFWDVRGHLVEGCAHLERLLDTPVAEPALEAAARDALGRLILARGDHDAGARQLRAAVALCQKVGDDVAAGWSLASLALGSVWAGHAPAALPLAEDAVRLIGSVSGRVRGRTLCALAVALGLSGRTAESDVAFDKSLDVFPTDGGDWVRGRTLQLRGWVAYQAGDLSSAHALAERARVLLDGIGDRRVVADCLDVLGLVAVRHEPAAAPARFAAANGLRAAAGIRRQPYLEQEIRATVLPEAGAAGLTPREAQVARLITEGMTNAAIGRRLGISERTAERHAENIRAKLGVGSRTQIAAWVAGRADTHDLPARGGGFPG